MKPKELLNGLHLTALTSSWWAFAIWPNLGYEESLGFGAIGAVAIVLTLIGLARVALWAIAEWGD